MTREKPTASQDRDQILAEHREIAELTATITDSRDREQLSDGLFRLEALLARHFQREESQDGLHESVEQNAPPRMPERKSMHAAAWSRREAKSSLGIV